jgi:hypothetical protein
LDGNSVFAHLGTYRQESNGEIVAELITHATMTIPITSR